MSSRFSFLAIFLITLAPSVSQAGQPRGRPLKLEGVPHALAAPAYRVAHSPILTVRKRVDTEAPDAGKLELLLQHGPNGPLLVRPRGGLDFPDGEVVAGLRVHSLAGVGRYRPEGLSIESYVVQYANQWQLEFQIGEHANLRVAGSLKPGGWRANVGHLSVARAYRDAWQGEAQRLARFLPFPQPAEVDLAGFSLGTDQGQVATRGPNAPLAVSLLESENLRVWTSGDQHVAVSLDNLRRGPLQSVRVSTDLKPAAILVTDEFQFELVSDGDN